MELNTQRLHIRALEAGDWPSMRRIAAHFRRSGTPPAHRLIEGLGFVLTGAERRAFSGPDQGEGACFVGGAAKGWFRHGADRRTPGDAGAALSPP